MHFLLVGPGALGCLLSAIISKALGSEDQLTILDYNPQRAAHLTAHSIVYQTQEAKEVVAVRAVSEPERLAGVDVILLCVKSYHVAASLEFCKPLLTEKSLLVFLQNGISHLELETPLYRAATAYGTTTEGATLLKTGHVHHTGRGNTYLGFREPVSSLAQRRLQKTCELLSNGGIAAEISDDILVRVWNKLFVNVGINALTASLSCKNGELLTLAGAAVRMEKAVDEAVRVAKALNIPVPHAPLDTTRAVCRNTAANTSSMLQDVRSRRRTEIDAINGAIVALGEKLNIDTPENRRLYAEIKALEAGYGAL